MIGLFGIQDYNSYKIIKDIYEFITSILNKDNLYFTVHIEDDFFNPIIKKINNNIRIEHKSDNFWYHLEKKDYVVNVVR